MASVAWLSLLGSASLADTAHEIIGKSIIFIKVTGETVTGLPVGSEGTGFVVTADGQILTSYHLLEQVKTATPESIKFQISVGSKDENATRRATFVDAKENVDLMLLKASGGGEPLIPVALGSAWALPKGTEVYTQGFPASVDSDAVQQEDQIVSTAGPGGYTWLLGKDVEDGQSGSPVYLADGKVIGVMKGQQGGIRGAFVPIEQAETLLLPIRLAGIRKDFDQLTKSVEALKSSPAESDLSSAITKYLDGAEGTAMVGGIVGKYLDSHINAVDHLLDDYMNKVLAYSYSSEFYLSEVKKYYTFRFYKTDYDKGNLECTATYPNNLQHSTIYYKLNDKAEEVAFVPSRVTPQTATFSKTFEKPNSTLWDFADDVHQNRQSLVFTLDDKEKITQNITVQCTILIIGPARVAVQ